MFRTFRFRLLFWFLVFSSFSFVVGGLSVLYLQTRERIQQRTEAVEQSYVMLLKSVRNQQDFFSYDTKSEMYCKTGVSQYLKQYEQYRDSTITLLELAQDNRQEFLLSNPEAMIPEVNRIDSLFMLLISKVKQRGFKDCNLEGEMRKDAHWLENLTEVSKADILTMRRHEKDYIIRNDMRYADELSELVDSVKVKVAFDEAIRKSKKDSILYFLDSYYIKFSQLVDLDQEIGIKDNLGLKGLIDKRIALLENRLGSAVQQAHLWAEDEFTRLTYIYGSIAILIVIAGLVSSALIANRLTGPLHELTEHITKFVSSEFELQERYPPSKSKDEIGSLTNNFLHMKQEVISTVTDFKKRVTERTKELEDAYVKMSRLNEANSRFVPREFLENLGKVSIEEVSLGDQVERDMTIVFTDIRQFTKISEELTPQENFDFLNEYYEGIVPIIKNNGGFIDKFIGDSVMALFPKESDQALKTVYAFEDFLMDLNQRRINTGRKPIKIGTGIHSGHLILGTIGHQRRLETTVISDAVNTASRVEGLSKYYDAKIVVTASTLALLENKDMYKHRFLDMVQVRGRSSSVSVYEFLTDRDTEKLASLSEYNEAIDLVAKKEIAEAAERFAILYEKNPNDKAVSILLDKCRHYLNEKLDTWQEVTQMRVKL